MRRERKLLNPPKIEPPEESGDGIIVVHHPDKAVVWPPHPEQVFAVVKILGLQHKVCKDDRVMLEDLSSSFKNEEDPDKSDLKVG